MSSQNNDENPYIKPENYWDEYNENLEKIQGNNETLEFAKLCFLLFESANGRALLKLIDENILMPSLVPIGTERYKEVSTYYEGYKEAFRFLKMNIQSHKDYIKNN